MFSTLYKLLNAINSFSKDENYIGKTILVEINGVFNELPYNISFTEVLPIISVADADGTIFINEQQNFLFYLSCNTIISNFYLSILE